MQPPHGGMEAQGGRRKAWGVAETTRGRPWPATWPEGRGGAGERRRGGDLGG